MHFGTSFVVCGTKTDLVGLAVGLKKVDEILTWIVKKN